MHFKNDKIKQIDGLFFSFLKFENICEIEK